MTQTATAPPASDRQAARDRLRQAEADHEARRPALVAAAEKAGKAAARAQAEADRLAAAHRDAEQAVRDSNWAIERVRGEAARVFLADVPALLTDTLTALRQQQREICAGNYRRTDSTAPALGRRALAIVDAYSELDRLARTGVDGAELADAVTALLERIDLAEQTEPPPSEPHPDLVAANALLYQRLEELRNRSHPVSPAKVEATIEAQRDLHAIQVHDPEGPAKARAILARVKLAIPEPPPPRRRPEPVAVPDDDE